jgi:hypothetical protein
MKVPHKRDSDSGAAKSRGNRNLQGSRNRKSKETTSQPSRPSLTKTSDLPPNENIRKRADEGLRRY